jgi:hypothetical protein
MKVPSGVILSPVEAPADLVSVRLDRFCDPLSGELISNLTPKTW